ncbi:three-helix bundle dimerization domain-containing protein [Mycobacterium sp. UM_WWY]
MVEESSDVAEATFRELVNRAIVHGHRPDRTTVVGPATWASIDLLAQEHPDATPDHIACAFDAFDAEHRHHCQIGVQQSGAEHVVATEEFVVIKDLVAQLSITYPDVDSGTVADVVRRIYADLDGHTVREFLPLVVEQVARRRLA